MKDQFLYLSGEDVHRLLQNQEEMVLNTVQDALRMMDGGTVIQPGKSTLLFDPDFQNRINCMSAALPGQTAAGVKWISVFPSNRDNGFDNVEGMVLLSETSTGKVTCMMNATEFTSVRTAALGALAARFLARQDAKTVGLIGSGKEAQAQFRMLKHVIPQLEKCCVSSRSDEGIIQFIKGQETDFSNVAFINCHRDYEAAVRDADIIVTAISSQEPVLKADWIKDGAFYIHVAGLEDEFAVAKKASKIVCDHWESVKHRSQTISQMYRAGELKDEDIYADLVEILQQRKSGRENEKEFIYFNSVGLAAVDILLCDRLREEAIDRGIGLWLEK